jgi:hypothetical protein
LSHPFPLLPAPQSPATGNLRTSGDCLNLIDHSLLIAFSIHLALHLPGSLPASLLSELDGVAQAAGARGDRALLARSGAGGVAPTQVALDEERDEEVGQRGEIEDIKPDSKRLATRREAGHYVALDAIDKTARNGDRRAVGGSRGRSGLGLGLGTVDDGHNVVDKGVNGGSAGTGDELRDLHRRKRPLDGRRHADLERRQGVVRVLQVTVSLGFKGQAGQRLSGFNIP